MGKVRQLDETLSNMIAAGEVVENMASVAKELIENAIDAEAARIDIRLKDAGLREIRVTDDGEGMDEEDIKLAFRRHATSKIRTEHDLHHIASLGFRGEALPSIASVSVVEIDSSPQERPGKRLTVTNGEITHEAAGRAARGTTITVKNLFYNTPARLKHLRSEKRELADVIDIVNKLALAHPSIRFNLENNGRTLLSTPGDGETLKVLREIYPLDVVKNLLPFANENRYFRIKGYTAKPAHTRSSRAHMTIITNHRAIKSNRIQNAILAAYRTHLPGHKFPITHLEITLDPLLVDVNIHPQKRSVKFTEEGMLLSLVEETIQATLAGADLIPRLEKKRPAKERGQSRLDFSAPWENESRIEEERQKEGPRTEKDAPPEEKDAPPFPKRRFPELTYIGQAFGTYLLFQDEGNLYLMDQHAAAERVRYERIHQALDKKDSGKKTLLTPFAIALSNKEVSALPAIAGELKELGLIVETMDATSLAIQEIPAWFPEGEEEAFAEKTIRLLLEEKKIAKARFLDHAAKELACKTSVRANKHLNRSEVDSLLKDLEAAKNPFTCPHGRPTIIGFSAKELETYFWRVQS